MQVYLCSASVASQICEITRNSDKTSSSFKVIELDANRGATAAPFAVLRPRTMHTGHFLAFDDCVCRCRHILALMESGFGRSDVKCCPRQRAACSGEARTWAAGWSHHVQVSRNHAAHSGICRFVCTQQTQWQQTKENYLVPFVWFPDHHQVLGLLIHQIYFPPPSSTCCSPRHRLVWGWRYRHCPSLALWQFRFCDRWTVGILLWVCSTCSARHQTLQPELHN